MIIIMAVCGPGEKIIVPHNIRISHVCNHLFLNYPLFVHPVMDQELGISHGVTTESVENAIVLHTDVKAVLIINPTYFGICTNLIDIVELSHRYKIPVLVDEAHAAHIHFHKDLPISAMQAGADMSAISIHKSGGSMTQTSILNVQEGLVSVLRVQAVISMLTTTSTSYILLASLDTARKQLALHGRTMAEESMRLAKIARDALYKIPVIYCVGKELRGSPATFSMDPTKLIIHVKDLNVTGPVFLPGEIFTQENIDYIQKNIAVGILVQGLEDETIKTIRVVKGCEPIQ